MGIKRKTHEQYVKEVADIKGAIALGLITEKQALEQLNNSCDVMSA